MDNITEIRAVYTDETIRVYQAYGKSIAEEVISTGKFGKHFSYDRMTWIKPSFLWMMYRSGWAEKTGQEYVFAIDIKRSAFDYLLENGMATSHPQNSDDFDEWRKKVHDSDILIQWDPERDIHGTPLGYRSIQIGLRGNAIKKYATEWIVDISDITEYVTELRKKKNTDVNFADLLPDERVYKRFLN